MAVGKTIKLNQDLPIEKKHGAVKGAEFVVTRVSEGRGRLYYFNDANGIECAAYAREFDFVE